MIRLKKKWNYEKHSVRLDQQDLQQGTGKSEIHNSRSIIIAILNTLTADDELTHAKKLYVHLMS